MADTAERRKESGEEDSGGVTEKIDLDMILTNELGGFGLYQLKTCVLTFIMVIFVAWGASEYMFTTARITTRCLIPECDSASPEFSPIWLVNAVPAAGDSFDNCQRYANNSDSVDLSGTCPAELFDTTRLLDCDDYVYANTDTVVYDYGLACDEWRRSFIGSARTFGTLTALPITGFVSDRWGRRTALTLNAFNTAWLGLVRYWANTYLGFSISEFIEATFGSGGFSCTYIMLMELVGPKYRVAAGAALNSFFSVGQVLLGLIAWVVPNWRNLTLALYIPQLLTISYFWLMNESIRWYMSKGRFEESEAVLKRVAKVNKKQLSEKSLQALRQTAELERKKREMEEADKESEPWLITLVFRHKKILTRCLVSPVWWITTTFIYYGLSINAVNMSGNRYLNYIAVSAVEIPGNLSAVFLMGKIGRKAVLIGGFWTCAACQIAYIFMPAGLYGASLTVYLIGKFSIALVATSVYVYTMELYPTKYRHSLFAFSSMMGRVGSILAPLTPALGAAVWVELPFLLFACMALLSGLLIFVTPETLGSKLPDTMSEAENICMQKKDIGVKVVRNERDQTLNAD